MQKKNSRATIFVLFIVLFGVLLISNPPESGADAASPLESTTIHRAQVFFNKKGLKSEIRIEGALQELNAISKTEAETIEELIEHTSIWIPRMYMKLFSINPRCIVILEKKVNKKKKAEIRFGVAMSCTPNNSTPEILHI